MPRYQRHGLSRTIFYQRWNGMSARCSGHSYRNKKYYKERGITVCERWLDFSNFAEDMYLSFQNHASLHGESDTSLDRIDNDKGYCPENCQWVTKEVQQLNKRPPSQSKTWIEPVTDPLTGKTRYEVRKFIS